MRRFDWLIPLLALVACGSGPADTDPTEIDKEEFACELGALNAEGGFAPYGEADDAEMVLGFQGFLFLRARVEAERAPSWCRALTSLEVPGEAPNGSARPEVSFEAGEGGHLSDQIPIFLPTANISAYVGQTATLAARLEGPTEFCVAVATVTLRDDDACVHAGGEDDCGDTGTP